MGVCTSQGRAFARGFVCDHAAPWAVFARHRVPVWGWVCTCTWDRACTGTGCARAKLWAVLAQCLHTRKCAGTRAGCALARGRGLARGCACSRSTVGDAQEHKLAQKLACTRAERGFAHRSVFARGCVCLHGAVPPRGPRTFPQQLRVPLARGLAQELALPGLAHAFPWHGAFAQGALHEAALAQAWQLGTGGVVLTRGVRVPLHGLTRALHRALCASVCAGVLTGGACKPLARGCELTACTLTGVCWVGPLHQGVLTGVLVPLARGCTLSRRGGTGGGGACALCTRVQAPRGACKPLADGCRLFGVHTNLF